MLSWVVPKKPLVALIVQLLIYKIFSPIVVVLQSIYRFCNVQKRGITFVMFRREGNEIA